MAPVLAGSDRGAFVFVSCPMDLNPHSQLVNHAIISIMISKAFSGNCRIAISKYLGNGCFECYYNNNDGLFVLYDYISRLGMLSNILLM